MDGGSVMSLKTLIIRASFHRITWKLEQNRHRHRHLLPLKENRKKSNKSHKIRKIKESNLKRKLMIIRLTHNLINSSKNSGRLRKERSLAIIIMALLDINM